MTESPSNLFFYSKHHLNNRLLQVIMLLIEYLPIMIITIACPSVINQYYNYSQYQSLYTNYIPFKIQIIIDMTPLVSIKLVIGLIAFLFLSLVSYHLSPFLFRITTDEINWRRKCVNKLLWFYFDMFLMRTANYYIIHLYFWLFICCLNLGVIQGYYYVLSFIAFTLLVWYMCLVYLHLSFNCVLLHLDCKAISNQIIDYPHDWSFSMHYDIVMIEFKIICSIEAVYFNSLSSPSIQFVMFCFNAAIALFVILFFLYLCYNTLIAIKLEWFMFNRLLVLMRIGIVLFLWYSIIFHLIFLSTTYSNSLVISFALMSLVWSILTIGLIWKLIIQGNLYNGKVTLIKMLFALFRLPEASLFQVNVFKLIHSFELDLSVLFPNELSKHISSCHNPLILISMINSFCEQKTAKKSTSPSVIHIYSDLIRLLFYSTKGKTLQYFCYYNTIIRKYLTKHKSVISNAHLLVNSFLSNEEDDNLFLFTELFESSKLNASIDGTLLLMNEIVDTPKEMMKPMTFYKLANKINQLKSRTRAMTIDLDLSENKNITDSSMRNLRQVKNYCQLIYRYLVETLTNEVLFKDNKIEIDSLKDYLSFHFLNDRTLLLSTALNRLSLNEETALGHIIKCGSELIKYEGQSVCQLFPCKFRREGIRQFYQKLAQYVSEDYQKANGFSSSNTPFEFVMNSVVPSFVNLFIYSFKIVPTLVKSEMIINGVYTSNDKVIIIFREEEGKLVLETFSSSVQNLLLITPELVEYLHTQSIFITFNELFDKCSLKSRGDALSEYDCQFSYQLFISYLIHLPNFSGLFQVFSRKNPDLDLKEKLRKEKETNYKVVNIKLSYLFAISDRHKYLIYSISALKGLKSIMHAELTNEDLENHHDNDNLFNLYQTTSTLNRSSVSSTTISTSDLLKKRKEDKNDTAKISDTFMRFSNLILFYLLFIILVCVIFLVVQIVQSQALYKINGLYYQFKTLQIFFSNSFLNIFSNICIALEKNDVCSNAYTDYSATIRQQLHLPPQYSTRDFVVNAVSFLIYNLQALYNSYNDNIHNYGNPSLVDILLIKMNYIFIKQLDNDIKPQVIQITLEEGLQRYLNSLSILNQAKGNFDAQQYTVHIITVKHLQADFKNVLTRNLNEVQTEVYKIFMNYINYSAGFSDGEAKLLTLYNEREKEKSITLYLYIALVIVFHLILALLCRWILIIVQRLLTSIINEIIDSLNQKELNLYLTTKIDVLTTLNKLYLKNPNSLLKDLAYARKELRKSYDSLKTKKESRIRRNSVSNIINYTIIPKNPKGFSVVKKGEISSLLLPVVLKIYVLFISFFICVVVFNVYLLHSFSDVMLINNYVLAHIGLESQLYDNIAFPQIMTLVNLTQVDLGIEMGMGDANEGILNMKVRQGAKFKEHIFNQEHDAPLMFPPMSSYFTYDCKGIFTLINDNITVSVSKLLGVDYLYYQIRICEKFNLTSLPNFELLYNEHNFRSQLLQDYLLTFSYDELYNFNEQFDFFDVFTLTIVILRPLKFYINEKILFKKIDTAFNQFIVIISGYLAFNIGADVIIFLIIKFVVLKRINEIHQNFLSLNKCFSGSKATSSN